MRRRPAWVWFIGLSIICGAGSVVFALTVHNRCEPSDPGCVFHSYTLVHRIGPGVLGFVGAPLVISLILVALLRHQTTHRSHLTARIAWSLAVLSGLLCLVGLTIEGIVMLPAAVLSIAAVATARLPPLPG